LKFRLKNLTEKKFSNNNKMEPNSAAAVNSASLVII